MNDGPLDNRKRCPSPEWSKKSRELPSDFLDFIAKKLSVFSDITRCN